MKTKHVYALGVILLLLNAAILDAASTKVLSLDQVEALIESGEEIEIPAGETYQLRLPGGDTAYLEEKTIFQLASIFQTS